MTCNQILFCSLLSVILNAAIQNLWETIFDSKNIQKTFFAKNLSIEGEQTNGGII